MEGKQGVSSSQSQPSGARDHSLAATEAGGYSRQVRRQIERRAAKRAAGPGPNRPPLIPKPGKPDRKNAHILWTVIRGRTEFYFHATKGLRTRYLGEAL